jgi:hypothetical protein
MEPLAIYVGFCQARLPVPPIPCELVGCEAEGCPHMVWCDPARAPEWHVLKVVCHHCVDSIIGRAG